jgi:hypothetical protein
LGRRLFVAVAVIAGSITGAAVYGAVRDDGPTMADAQDHTLTAAESKIVDQAVALATPEMKATMCQTIAGLGEKRARSTFVVGSAAAMSQDEPGDYSFVAGVMYDRLRPQLPC